MLPKTNRLTKTEDIKQVLQSKKSSGTKNFTCKYAINKQKESRTGFIVSNKVSKQATKRNKLKRQMRNIIQKASINPGYDVIIIAKPPAIELSFEKIKEEILYCLNKNKLCDTKSRLHLVK